VRPPRRSPRRPCRARPSGRPASAVCTSIGSGLDESIRVGSGMEWTGWVFTVRQRYMSTEWGGFKFGRVCTGCVGSGQVGSGMDRLGQVWLCQLICGPDLAASGESGRPGSATCRQDRVARRTRRSGSCSGSAGTSFREQRSITESLCPVQATNAERSRRRTLLRP